MQGDIGLNVAKMIAELIRDNRKIVDRITQEQIELFVGLLKINKVQGRYIFIALITRKPSKKWRPTFAVVRVIFDLPDFLIYADVRWRGVDLSPRLGGHTVANQPPTTVLLSCDVLLRTTYLLYGMKS